MMNPVKKYIEPLNIKNLILVNFLILLAIKVAVPLSGTQLATVLEQISPFDSRGIIAETNKARVAQGLGPVSPNSQLDIAASEKLNDMISKEYFAHVSPQGVSPWFWVTQAGYKYSYAGENLALGFSDATSTVDGWMNSPTHKDNLLNKNYTEIGVATGKANLSGVNGILVVQVFGRPSSTLAVAQSNPAPKTTPVVTPNVLPAVESLVSGSETSLVINEISTDEKVPKVNGPLKSVSADSLESVSVSDKMGLIYQIYIGISIIVVGIAMGFLGTRKNLVLAMAANFALLIVAVAVPAVEIAGKSLIF